MIVAPSIIAADFSQIQKEIKKVEEADADMLHLDIMDGVFVPNMTFGPMVVEAINRITEMELDSHLMIIKPEKYLGAFIDAGSDWISFHAEVAENPDECIKFIKKRKKKAGLALNPGTSFENVIKFIEELDYLLIMSVNPGFYGQKFMPEVLKKIEQVKSWIVKHKLPCLVQVDGGIYHGNVSQLAKAGADIVVAGAGVFKAKDYKEAIKNLRC